MIVTPRCRFCSASIPPRWPSPASQRNASIHISAMAGGRSWPPASSPRAQGAGIVGGRVPGRMARPLCAPLSRSDRTGRAMTGWSITSRPPGVWTCAAWWPQGARSPGPPRRWHVGASDGPSGVSPPLRLASMARPPPARGATQSRCGAVSWPAVAGHGVIFVRARTVRPGCATPWRPLIPTTPLPRGGPRRDSRASAPPLAVPPVANHAMVGRGAAPDPNVLHGPSLPLDRTSVRQPHW